MANIDSDDSRHSPIPSPYESNENLSRDSYRSGVGMQMEHDSRNGSVCSLDNQPNTTNHTIMTMCTQLSEQMGNLGHIFQNANTQMQNRLNGLENKMHILESKLSQVENHDSEIQFQHLRHSQSGGGAPSGPSSVYNRHSSENNLSHFTPHHPPNDRNMNQYPNQQGLERGDHNVQSRGGH